MTRADAIRHKLDTFGLDYYSQTNMPGRIWTVTGQGWTRRMTTVEAEAFVFGYGVALADRDVC